MSVRRMLAKLFINKSRNPVKKCSIWKVVTVLCVTFFIWSVIVLMNATHFRQGPQRAIENLSVKLPEKSVSMHPLDYTERPEIFNVFSYEELILENPLGMYFSDRMSGRVPVGKSHLEYVRLKRNKLLKMVLIFVQKPNSSSLVIFGEFFAKQRIEYRFRAASKELPPLVLEDMGVARYSLLVFEEFSIYLTMDPTRRAVLDNYCKKYNIGVLALVQSPEKEHSNIFNSQKLKIIPRVKLKKYKLNPEANIWRVGKVSEIYLKPLPTSDWTIFIADHKTYRPLVFSSLANQSGASKDDVTSTDFGCVPAIHDRGLLDGIQRVILGYSLDFWLNTIVATDAITYLTGGLFALPLTRFLQVDIDDMFVGVSGLRTLVKDAKAMVASQEKISKRVPGFSYKLGFSGEFFLRGNQGEQAGDRSIVELARHFLWFDHLNRHERLLNLNRTGLQTSMEKNARFAQEHSLPLSRGYMVPPYHAGVYPIYESLYDEWTDRQVTCTSTMEYPKESPVWGRRGFIYRNVMVLPRLDCNLYTSVNKFEDFTGGKEGLDRSIQGELLFKLFLHTPVLVFMTHMSNYANDQLGQYYFENGVEFVTKWTRLKLAAMTPEELAKTYFQMYPLEVVPLWTNPCEYNSKHLEILPPDVNCSRFPKLFILGPHNAGLTTLENMLETCPAMKALKEDAAKTNGSHFFSGGAYLKGLHWYQSQFPETAKEGGFLFESSQHYFHDAESPKRVAALVPKAKIVIVLAEPVTAALCCYHNLEPPLRVENHTLHQTVIDEDKSIKSLPEIKAKCLQPLAYAVHLARWLHYFSKEQILVVSRDQLRQEPLAVLGQVEKFLGVGSCKDLASKLRHDLKNNSICREDGSCLSPLEDQNCPQPDDQSRKYLQTYFQDHNTNLKMLLDNINQRSPQWLSETRPR